MRAVKTATEATLTIQGMSLTIKGMEIKVFPDRVFTSQAFPFGEVVKVLDGAEGWMRGSQGIQDLPGALREEAEADRMRDVIWLLSHYKELPLEALEPFTERGAPQQRGSVTADAPKDWILLFNERGRLVGMDYQSTDQGGPATMSARYRRFMEVEGLTLPSLTEVRRDGEPRDFPRGQSPR